MTYQQKRIAIIAALAIVLLIAGVVLYRQHSAKVTVKKAQTAIVKTEQAKAEVKSASTAVIIRREDNDRAIKKASDKQAVYKSVPVGSALIDEANAIIRDSKADRQRPSGND